MRKPAEHLPALSASQCLLLARTQLMDVLISGRAARGFILAAWLHKDGPERARERLDLTMKLLADGVMTPPSGEQAHVHG